MKKKWKEKHILCHKKINIKWKLFGAKNMDKDVW